MFTGIVEELGIVKKLERTQNLFVLKIRASKIFRGLKTGDSVAVNGVCLTITNIIKNNITFDIMRETILRTALGYLKVHERVNLERALKLGARFSGHFVTGHIDHVARIRNKIQKKNFAELQIQIPREFSPFIVEKGSICVDGVSLTIGKVARDYFSVYLIPFTLKMTTLGEKKVGDPLNIEIDILARYTHYLSKGRP